MEGTACRGGDNNKQQLLQLVAYSRSEATWVAPDTHILQDT